MIRSEKRLRLCTALLVCNLLFIWGNSLLPAELSGAFSDWVRELLMQLFPFAGDGMPGGGGLLRKAAHFTEFTCLGMCLMWLCGMLGKPAAVAFAGGFATACVDETIQAFVPGRAPGVVDVLIDTSGVLTGICLLLLGHHYLQKRKI